MQSLVSLEMVKSWRPAWLIGQCFAAQIDRARAEVKLTRPPMQSHTRRIIHLPKMAKKSCPRSQQGFGLHTTLASANTFMPAMWLACCDELTLQIAWYEGKLLLLSLQVSSVTLHSLFCRFSRENRSKDQGHFERNSPDSGSDYQAAPSARGGIWRSDRETRSAALWQRQFLVTGGPSFCRVLYQYSTTRSTDCNIYSEVLTPGSCELDWILTSTAGIVQ